MMIRSAA